MTAQQDLSVMLRQGRSAEQIQAALGLTEQSTASLRQYLDVTAAAAVGDTAAYHWEG